MTEPATATLGRLSCELGHPLVDFDKASGCRLTFKDGATGTIAADGSSTLTVRGVTVAYGADGTVVGDVERRT